MHTFHPAVSAWFESAFDAPTEAQSRAWPAIQSHQDVLIAAPTGSGKTLAAFLAAIDDLVRRGVAGTLNDETHVVYVSPLKALSNDVRINLEMPIEGIRAQLELMGLPDVEIRTAVRTGDTPQAERNAMRKRPPHIVVTTPESLYILLGSGSGRAMLATTRTVIVDEIHALTPNKRGSHLSLSLARLDALCGQRPVRIGLSATQKPIEEVARFLVGLTDGTAPSDPLPPTAASFGGEGRVRGQDGKQRARADAAETEGPELDAPVHRHKSTPAPSPRRVARLGGPLPRQATQPSASSFGRSAAQPMSFRAWAERAASPPAMEPPGESEHRCTIIDTGHQRARDLG
ncbi:MAG TPA: DEAD/DEAH box helicase, partial [Rhodanobacteraceae bacterium]|nr:DEAD/DEAH box helicase [Rhodanobacteraceae bacterium]